MGNEADKLTKRHKEDPVLTAINAHAKSMGQAIAQLSDNMGKWLSVLAIAVSTPEDNSEEVKRLTAELKAEADAFEDAVDNAPK